MTDLTLNGFDTSHEQLQDGDVALVIRKDGRVQAMIPEALKDRPDMEDLNPNIMMVYGMILLMAQDNLIHMAAFEAERQIKDAMQARVISG
tara:strand:- start:397 stop:669 length:273 start_codon:yes stop_codon:yes gene_type:complete